MNFNDYFEPVSLDKPGIQFLPDSSRFCNNISIHTANHPVETIEGYTIAIIGVPEDRKSPNDGCALAPDTIRSSLYQLSKLSGKTKIIDLGNLRLGKTLDDTYFGLTDVLDELLKNNINPLIIGGSQALTYSCFQAYQKISSKVNLVTIDPRLDLANNSDEMDAGNYLGAIIREKNKNLLNITNIGYQTYYVDQDELDFFNNLFFDANRLGMVRSNLNHTEPILRDANIVSIDISSVRFADAPGYISPSPNGFYGEEVCQLSRYTGLNNRLTIFGLYEVNPKTDQFNITSNLAAQIVWFYMDGVCHRIDESPINTTKNFKKFIVKHSKIDFDLVFYKSLKSEKWWVEVPVLNPDEKSKIITACNYDDYLVACNQDIPDRWWKYFQKLN